MSYVFYFCLFTIEYSSSGTSYINRTEAVNVEKIVTSFLNGGVFPDKVCESVVLFQELLFYINYHFFSSQLTKSNKSTNIITRLVLLHLMKANVLTL